MVYKCLIVDDEQPARSLLETYVEKTPQLELVQSCKSGLEAIQCLQDQNIHLIFLDIQMPDLTGVDLLKSMRNPPITIFTTAYQEYALEGYELDIVDYLLKPFTFSRFTQAVNKATEILVLKQASEGVLTKGSDVGETLIIKAEHKIHKVNVQEILYIQGLREYVTYHFHQSKIISLESLKSIADKLSPAGFVRVHKSFIVNKSYVELMEGNQLKIGDEMIPVGASFRDGIVKEIFE